MGVMVRCLYTFVLIVQFSEFLHANFACKIVRKDGTSTIVTKLVINLVISDTVYCYNGCYVKN